jgi:anaphase-promoting complex subunit 3
VQLLKLLDLISLTHSECYFVMPLTTASKRSGGGIDAGQGTTGQTARPAAIPRSGSASSNGSGINRARPNPLRREATSTSSVRPKLTSQGSSSASTSQLPQAPASILQSIPKPSFPPSEAFDYAVDESLIHARLLQLAQLYLQQHDRNDKNDFQDIHSASLYARLALQTDPTSVTARRLLATTLLHGAQPFPFGPSTIHSSPLSLTSQSTTPLASASIAGAHAAIEVLKDGNEDVFMDVGCARIYAKACAIIGKTREGKDAMAWTLKTAAEKRKSKGLGSPSSSAQSISTSVQPPRLDLNGAEEAMTYNDLAYMASKNNQFKEAAAHFARAKSLDRWSWTAWVGSCDVGNDERVTNMFCGENHKPTSFYTNQLQGQLLNNNIDVEVVRKTIEDLKARGEDFFTSGPLAGRDEEGTTIQSAQIGGVSTNVLRKAVGGTATTGTTPVNATPMFARAGTREEASTATTAGTKRIRTTTAGSGNGGTVPRLGPGIGQQTKSGVNINADTHANKRPAVSGFRARGPMVASQQLANTNARIGGTLAAMRTNGQQRPGSSASGSSRGGSDKEILKPRRSARVHTAVIDDTPEQQEQPPVSPKNVSDRPVAGTGQARRPLSKPASITNPTSETQGGVGPRKAVGNRGTAGDGQGSSKVLVSAMETAAFESARQAAVWTSVDKRVKELLHTLAMAYYAVKNLRSKSAIILLRRKKAISSSEKADLKRGLYNSAPLESFTGLDDCYRNTVDVQCLLARAHHDMASYHLAEKHFVHARRLSPSLDTHMDIYSLTLFHLQREVQLSRLARELSQIDANSSVSHIAKGNAFALQREHSLALQSFQRACLAAPNCAYAFTLAGYEAHELGFKDKSVRYFRQAINIDKRHWNAFAGLARVYVDSERYNSAEYYYRRAIAIHETNPVLWDVYGSVLSSQDKFEEAQEAFARAIQLDPSLAMSHIKLAEILLLQGQTAPEKRIKAHEHLLEAVKHAPEEAHVHLMLAHTYMELGKGSFARIDQGGKKRRISGAAAVQQILLPSELQQLGSGGSSGPSSTSRAIGNSTIPNAYQAEIAKHLCAAIDLDPRYVRYVKAMGEGAKAALRGIVSRFMMDANGGADGSTLLMDSSAVMEGQTVDSMVDLEGDQVLEDATAMTEELDSEDEQEENGEEDEEEQEQEQDHNEGSEDGASEAEMMEDDITADDLENESTDPIANTQQTVDQSDVSMSF